MPYDVTVTSIPVMCSKDFQGDFSHKLGKCLFMPALAGQELCDNWSFQVTTADMVWLILPYYAVAVKEYLMR